MESEEVDPIIHMDDSCFCAYGMLHWVESDLPEMIALLGDDEEAVRYWAAIGCVILGDKAKDASSQLQKALDDPYTTGKRGF